MNNVLLQSTAAAEPPNISLLGRLMALAGASPPAAPQHPPADAPAAPAATRPAAEAWLTEATALLQAGQPDAAQTLLRQVPEHGSCRAAAVGLTVAAARLDPEFRDHIAQADRARDRHAWNEAEYLYWRALALYPLHAGYLVQYGHALKEQGKFADAEAAYRSALALGETASDLPQHIAHAAAALGHAATGPAPTPERSRIAAALPLDEPPSRDDVEVAFALVLHRKPRLAEEVLPLLRSAPTRRAVLGDLLAREEAVVANRDLLLLLAQTA